MNFMFTIAAIAVMGGALFGSSFTSQMTGAAFSTDVNAMQKIHDMGGLELVMPAAFAEAVAVTAQHTQIVLSLSSHLLV